MRCTMIFFDTNILVYATINQGTDKLELSEKYIEDAMLRGTLFISPLVFSEYIFILSKLKVINEHYEDIELFSKFIGGNLNREVSSNAFTLCRDIDFCKNINDLIHLKIAEQYCSKLVTFDRDFKKLENYTDIEIEILK